MMKISQQKLRAGLLLAGTGVAMAGLFIAALTIAPREATATPAFAAINKAECGFCHMPGTQGMSPPQLNKTGDYYKQACIKDRQTMNICWPR